VNAWVIESGPFAGRLMHLLTSSELIALPPGTSLICIDGSTVVTGEDEIDDDTRYGFTAFGLLDPQL
jgi:hypothetical protein